MNKQLLVLLLICIILSSIVSAEIITKRQQTRKNIFSMKSNRMDLRKSTYAQLQTAPPRTMIDKALLQKKTGLKAGAFESGKAFAKGQRISLRKIEPRTL